MKTIFVVSEKRGDGKTAIAVTLAQKAIEAGTQTVITKPFGSADEIDDQSDPTIFHKLVGSKLDESTPIPKGGLTKKAIEDFAKSVKKLKSELTIVEASSELSPKDSAALANALDAAVLVVISYQKGMKANDILAFSNNFDTSQTTLIINSLGTYLGTEANALTETLKEVGTPVIGIIPEDRRLLGVTVRKLVEHLDGRFVSGEQERGEDLVEHFLVGGWMMDEGALYFSTRDDKAVIIRGDRPDIQMSALSTPTKVLVCTNGIEPIEYVAYEAKEEGTAVALVEQDTISAMESLGRIVETSQFDHPDKLIRMSNLIDGHADQQKLSELISS